MKNKKSLLLLLIGTCFLVIWSEPAFAQTLERLTEQIKPQVAQIRKLPFLQEIEVIFQSPEEFLDVLRREIERTYPGETFRILEKRLLKFGFIVSPIRLNTLFTQLYSQQIAGYYDPLEKKMALIQGNTTGKQTSFLPLDMLSRLFAQSLGLSLDTILLAHELTHALQDQHFDLLSLPFEDLGQKIWLLLSAH